MTKLFGFIGATIGGYIGWALGEVVASSLGFEGGSLVLAFMLGMVGTGLGMYYAARWARNTF